MPFSVLNKNLHFKKGAKIIRIARSIHATFFFSIRIAKIVIKIIVNLLDVRELALYLEFQFGDDRTRDLINIVNATAHKETGT